MHTKQNTLYECPSSISGTVPDLLMFCNAWNAGSGGNDGLYDSARSVTAQQQQSFQAQVTKTLSTGISHSQETGPVRTVTAATFSNATGPVHAWAPPRAGAAVQAAGLKGYASTPSWSKPPEMASGLQGRRMATAREFYSTEHASSIKIA